MIQLQQIVNGLKPKLPQDVTVQKSSDQMIAEIQKILNSSAIFATQALADLSLSLPSVLPAFPVIIKKVQVLYEAANFALDSSGKMRIKFVETLILIELKFFIATTSTTKSNSVLFKIFSINNFYSIFSSPSDDTTQ